MPHNLYFSHSGLRQAFFNKQWSNTSEHLCVALEPIVLRPSIRSFYSVAPPPSYVNYRFRPSLSRWDSDSISTPKRCLKESPGLLDTQKDHQGAHQALKMEEQTRSSDASGRFIPCWQTDYSESKDPEPFSSHGRPTESQSSRIICILHGFRNLDHHD
ncbi:uncharacterized protein ACBT44_016336 isoform 1-T1 [Syngnathus typhle]